MRTPLPLLLILLLPAAAFAQPETPVEEWTGKKILLIGAHPDDDGYSHGTLALLRENGNEVYVLLMTSGNVGTKDPKMTRTALATIRQQEETNALAQLGIPADHYINLGYDDGRLEYADREEAIGKLVYWIRTIHPDVLFAFDPGQGGQRWHKADHRAASYLAADATRAAEWALLYQGQIIHDGLEAWQVPAYLFFDSAEEARDTCVDVTDQLDKKIAAAQQYVSQFTSAWENYRPDVPQEELDNIADMSKRRLKHENGRYFECFRYYAGPPDGIGR